VKDHLPGLKDKFKKSNLLYGSRDKSKEKSRNIIDLKKKKEKERKKR